MTEYPRRSSRSLPHRLTTLAALAVGIACHAAPASTAPPSADPPGTSAAASPQPHLGLDLDLGFEQGTAPKGWRIDRSDYPVTLDDAHAFEGKRSLKLVHDGIHGRGHATLPLPAEAVRGHQLTARARVRTEGVSHGGAGLMLMAHRGLDTLDRRFTPPPARVHGDQDWTTVELSLDVPADAEKVELVLAHSGNGTAWFDAIELQLHEIPAPPPPARLTGTVRDQSGAPVPNATVVVFTQTGEHTAHTTDADGRFSVEVAATGPHLAGASAPAGVASTMAELTAGDQTTIELRLAPGTQRLHGIIRDDRGHPYPGALAMVMTAEELVYPATADAEGRFSVSLPASTQYMAMFEGSDGQRVLQEIDDPNAELSPAIPRAVVAPQATLDWIADHHVPLRTAEPGSGTDDLAGLRRTFAKATVVGLGEATHGTREFFQLKHRLLEYLVEHHGFTVFGLEASRTECRALDRYVQTGEGDPKEALRGIYFWTWNTEEVLALVEWMRRYNETHERTLHFVGFDMQSPEVAARNVLTYLEPLNPQAPGRDALTLFTSPWNHELHAALSPAERSALEAELDALRARFEDRRADWVARSSAQAYADALEDLVQVRQVATLRAAPGPESFATRDRAMADNVLHLEQRFGKGTKAVLWAHNGHVGRSWSQTDVMGGYLADALGDRYVSVGFAFDHGGFQALAIDGDQMTGLREHQVGSAQPADLEAALREGGPALYALPLRELPRKGPVAQWLRSPRPMRQIGAAFDRDDLGARVVEVVPDRFDVLVFVEETTRARPIVRD